MTVFKLAHLFGCMAVVVLTLDTKVTICFVATGFHQCENMQTQMMLKMLGSAADLQKALSVPSTKAVLNQ